MTVYVKTVGTLKSLQEGVRVIPLDVPEGTSVSEVLDRLRLQEWEVGFILINGTRATKESILKDQDQLILIAPLAGG